MGIIRTVLALAVVLSHTIHSGLVGGRNAVQMFYVISGFLISFVLVEKKSYPSIRTFYANRYLRLYPIYAVVALATLALLLFQPDSPFWRVYRDAPVGARLLLTLSNLSLFGQDWVMFAGVRGGQLVPAKNFNFSDPVLYEGLLAPQAWTLGVELTFYLIAPFVLPRRKLLLGLLAASLLLRALTVSRGFGLVDPWTYRFFPTELAFFLLGALVQQTTSSLYRRMDRKKIARQAAIATCGLLGACLVYAYLPFSDAAKTILLLATFIPLVPLLFEFQRDRPVDRYVGELSYPIYINHMFVILCLEAAFRTLNVHSVSLLAVLSVAGSIALAVVLEKLVGLPLEGMRANLKRRSLARDRAHPPALQDEVI